VLVLLGVGCFGAGVSLLYRGLNAITSGEVLPPAPSRGPMTGGHAIFAGALSLVFGVGFVYLLLSKRRK